MCARFTSSSSATCTSGRGSTVDIQKNLSQFAHPGNIPHYLNDASKIIGASDWATVDRDQFATAAATVFAYVNQAHPFREGNGRTSKLFMQQVAELSPYRIDYSPAVSGVTPEIWNQASMLSGPDRGKYEPVPASLVPVFRALATERIQAPSPGSPDPARDSARDRSARSASYPRPATEATRPSQESGPQARRSGPYLPGQNRSQGRGE
jgi:cell filamentation protein